jgi:pSer/pThr/pTyr-binding forkhead associated (FHA) protein
MAKKAGKFTIKYGDPEPRYLDQDGIRIGRLDTCDIVLDDKSVSRVHAGINFIDGQYEIVNLTAANALTLNGRLLPAQKTDVLASGDTVQIGPFAIEIAIDKANGIRLGIQRFGVVATPAGESARPQTPAATQAADVLRVFWEKRSREKEDWGTRLRPTEKPKPGKAMFNWRPTRDLRRPWRAALFVWAILIVGAIGVLAYFKKPQAYEPLPLSNPHATAFETTTLAAASNNNSCTTCHMADQPIDNACIKCHTAEGFHPSNTKAHETAGITCTTCHKEHRGPDFSLTASAIASCAQCHNDNNKQTYNGQSVRTPHGGSYGYPAENGVWKWQGVYREVADAIPEINYSATGDKDEQAKLSRQFHAVHVARLVLPPNSGLKGDAQGRVSCSTCHQTLGSNIDRVTPKQTCAACHMTSASDASRDQRFTAGQANCVSCHTQHPYSTRRWSEFLSDDALRRRQEAVTAKIAEGGQQQ